jgi:AcrR family transcriptional regulator
VSTIPRPTGGASTAERVLDSACREIDARGILGLRVGDVAAGAGCSVSVLYRHFGSRDGLLAAALGRMFDDIVERALDRAEASIPPTGPVTGDDLLRLLPEPTTVRTDADRRVRLQVLAVAATSSELEAHVERTVEHGRNRIHALLVSTRGRFAAGAPIDEPTVECVLQRSIIEGGATLQVTDVDVAAQRTVLQRAAGGR